MVNKQPSSSGEKFDSEWFETLFIFIIAFGYISIVAFGTIENQKWNDQIHNEMEAQRTAMLKAEVEAGKQTSAMFVINSIESRNPSVFVKQPNMDLFNYCEKIRWHDYEWVDRGIYQKCIDAGYLK